MKRVAIILSAAVALLVPSCVTRGDSSGPVDDSSQRAPQTVLAHRAGTMRLLSPAMPGGPLAVAVGTEMFLGGNRDALAAGGQTDYSMGGVAVKTGEWTAIGPAIVSNDWQFLRFEIPVQGTAALRSIQRSVVCIEPDLLVVLDTISSTKPVAAVERRYWFAGAPAHDPARDEWNIRAGTSGLTARFFSSPGAKQITGAGGSSCVSFAIPEGAQTIHQMAVLVGHWGAAKRSLAFKFLESDSAIGVRVHRDGLPTLVAFRKDTTTGEAVLAGLKFNQPVAVDVFKPKRK